jgi:type II secretory pathway pseudopilin PulG
MAFLRARVREEGGFTILESMVALVIIFGVLLTMLRTLDAGIRVLVETKRQAVASALANELLERARSLEWENTGLTANANNANCPDGDPATKDGVGCPTWTSDLGVSTILVGSQNQYTFEGDVVTFLNEDQTFDPFLQFHQQVTRDNTVFDRFLFVTSLRSDPADSTTERFRKLTAVVQWTPPSGFRKEVRHVTYVSPFEEPSQPFLQGTIIFDGGFVEVSGMVEGTSDFDNAAAARPFLNLATVEFPDAQVSAVTDYISGAAVLGEGTVGETRWADNHTTVDVAVVSGGSATQYEKRADDEFGSAAPLDDPSTGLKSFDSWYITSNAAPHDFLADEETDPPPPHFADQASVEGEAWTQYNPTGVNPKVDGLPFARLSRFDSAEVVAAGFTEYFGGSLLDQTFYLKGDGAPKGSLSALSPTAVSLPNYDPACDAAAGRLLQKSSGGLGETGTCKYQLWVAAAGQVVINGSASVQFWSGIKDFDEDERGVVDGYLLDCPSGTSNGTDCTLIAQGRRDLADWQSDSNTWVARDISFGAVSYTVPLGRSLAVKLVVANASDDDMWFAYDTISHPSALKLTLGTSFTNAPYDFYFVWAGDASGPMLHYEGWVDRYETSLTARRVDVDFTWDGEQVYFARDQAYDSLLGNARKFLGWVKVELPMVGGRLYAGEAAAPPSWDASGNVRISYWNPTAGAGGKGAYVLLYDKTYSSLINGPPETVYFDAVPTNATLDGPFSYTLSDPAHPKLAYQVRATLTVNPPIENVTIDALGDRAQVVMQAPSVVTGLVEYNVQDTAAGQVLFDVDITFGLGGVDATARYINPDAL